MKLFKFFGSLVATAAVVVTLNSCAYADETAQKFLPSPRLSLIADNTLSGNYLAGRFAQRQQDWDSAQRFMNEVMGFDANNTLLRQRAFLLTLGAQQYDRAKDLARQVASDKDGAELADIYLACDALAHDDFKGAIELVNKLPDDGFGQYTKPLLTAWSLVGMGKKAEGLKLLQKGSDPADPTYNMHAGLMEELTGDMKAAGVHYKTAMENGLTMHTAIIVGNYYLRNGQPDTAKTIYETLGKLYAFNPFMGVAASANANVSPNVTRAADGAAVALFDLATLLFERRAYDSAQIYGSMVLLLSPKSPFAAMMMGDIAALNDQHEKAVEDYNSIAHDSPLYWLSRTRVAEVYEAEGHMDQAVALLTELSQTKETHLQALVSLGDMYRRHDQYQEAFNAYDNALSSVDKISEEHWPIVYARGMSLERLNNWQLAEKDLLTALRFQPDNPMILNFIGYSWADKGVHLDQALDFIRRAVAQRPDDGYILDSYGWALYRTGDYKEAVVWMEKAIGIIPDDSTMLDHLGDAYWQVGRQNEARFKWRRAHELSKDASFRAGVEHKLTNGVVAPPSVIAHKDSSL